MALIIRFRLLALIIFSSLALPLNSLANDVSKRGNSLTYIRNEFQTNLDIYRTDGRDAQCFNMIRARQHATDAIELGDKSLARKFNAFNARFGSKCRLSAFSIPGTSNPTKESANKQIEGEYCPTFSELMAMADKGKVVSSCYGGYMLIRKL